MNTSTKNTIKSYTAGFLAYAVMFAPVSALLTAPMPALASGLLGGASAVSSALSTGGALDGISSATVTTHSSSLGSADTVSATITNSNSTLSSGAGTVTNSTTLGSADAVSAAVTTTSATANLSSADATAAAVKSTETTNTANLSNADKVAAAVQVVEKANDANLSNADKVAEAVQAVAKTQGALLGDATSVSEANKCVWNAQHPILGINDQLTLANGTVCPVTTGGNGPLTPTITSNGNISITKTTGTYTTTNNITTHLNGSTSTVVVTCNPATIDNSVVATTPVICQGSYVEGGTTKYTNTASYSYTVKDTTCTSNCGGSTSNIPTITSGGDKTVTKTVGSYITNTNITINLNGSTATVTVACLPPTVDTNIASTTPVSCTGSYVEGGINKTTNTVTYNFTVTSGDCTSNCGGGNGGSTSTAPTITSNGDKTITKTPGTFTTDTNVTINQNGSSSTVTVVCTPSTIDMNTVAVTSVSCVGNYASSTTNTVTYKYTVNDTTGGGGGGGCGSNCGGGNGGGSTVIGSYANPGEVLGLSTDDGTCSYLEEYLRLGNANNPAEVLKLQAFLKVYQKADVDVTGIFDLKTDSAVRAFQVKYKADVLTPWGLKGSTGYVYYTTKKKINEIRCEQEYALTAQQRSEINGYRLALANWSAHVAQAGKSGTSASAAKSNESNGASASTSLPVATNGSSGLWAKIKNSLFAALGMFKSKDASKSGDAKNSVSGDKGQNKADTQVASTGASNNSLISTLIALIAIAFGVLAFAMAAYLYRRTRGDDEMTGGEAMSA